MVLQGSLLGLATPHRRGVVHRDYNPRTHTRYDLVMAGGKAGSRRSQSLQDRVRRRAGPPQGLLLGVPAPHLPRRRHGQERDRGQPVRAAGPRHRPDRRRAEGPAAGPRRRGRHHHPVAAARRRRRRARHGRRAGAARPARPGLPAPDLALRQDHLPGDPARLQAVHPDLVGRCHPGRRPGRGRGQHR